MDFTSGVVLPIELSINGNILVVKTFKVAKDKLSTFVFTEFMYLTADIISEQ